MARERERRDYFGVAASLLAFFMLLGAARASEPDRQGEARGKSLDIPPNTWVVRKTPPFPGSIGKASKHVRLVYDSDRHLVYAWGGDYCVATGCSGHREFWSYDVAKDVWTLILDNEASKTQGFPTGRCLPAMAYDSTRKVVWMTGGEDVYTTEQGKLIKGGLWAFIPETRTWRKKGPANYEIPRRKGGTQLEYAAYDPFRDELIIPAFDSGSGSLMATFSLRNIDLNEPKIVNGWAFSGLGADEPLLGKLSFALDTRRQRAVMYLSKKGETWSYDLKSRRASLLKKQMLPAKSVFGMIYDSVNDRVALFGGYDNHEGAKNVKPLNDLWIFDPDRNEWSKLNASGAIPPPRKGETIAFDAENNVIVQTGGTGGWQGREADRFGYNGGEIFLLRLGTGRP
ncbi:MAG TPA: kelch repeat-containing protein [Candidatus Acidoferrales bacterium]|nr:kelch repeat-containing protein [Candidatus Acidoferrales bacterium]